MQAKVSARQRCCEGHGEALSASWLSRKKKKKNKARDSQQRVFFFFFFFFCKVCCSPDRPRGVQRVLESREWLATGTNEKKQERKKKNN